MADADYAALLARLKLETARVREQYAPCAQRPKRRTQPASKDTERLTALLETGPVQTMLQAVVQHEVTPENGRTAIDEMVRAAKGKAPVIWP